MRLWVPPSVYILDNPAWLHVHQLCFASWPRWAIREINRWSGYKRLFSFVLCFLLCVNVTYEWSPCAIFDSFGIFSSLFFDAERRQNVNQGQEINLPVIFWGKSVDVFLLINQARTVVIVLQLEKYTGLIWNKTYQNIMDGQGMKQQE